MLILYLDTKFHIPSSIGPLVIIVKLKAKWKIYMPPYCYFTFYRKWPWQKLHIAESCVFHFCGYKNS